MNPHHNPGRALWHSARLLIGFAALAAAALVPASAKTHLKIAASAPAVDSFNNWTATTPWEGITTYKNANAIRPAVDLLLQLQALKAGGLDFDYEVVRVLTYELAKQEVIEGRADLAAETIWDSEITGSSGALRAAGQVIRDGEFVQGIYVLPTNAKLLKVTSADGLHDTTAAVVATWALDVKTLYAMSLKGVQKVATPELAYSAVRTGKADFVLEQFSMAPDMHVERSGISLVPVPNCKIAIRGSRSWVVSAKSPAAAAVAKALEAGEKKLRDNGTIQRAYAESGFFNGKVADWKLLN